MTMQKLTEKERRTILVHAMVVNGTLVNFYTGKPLPDLREGAMVDLRIAEMDFTKKDELKVLAVERTEKFLFPGQRVFIRLNEYRMRKEDHRRLIEAKTSPFSGPPSLGAMVHLQEEVVMRLSGSKKGSLGDAKCSIPALGNTVARSLNHAYTLLSKEFEVDRRSFGGNVFEVAFLEDGKDWIPLETIRDHVMATHEREIMTKLGIADVDGRIKEILERK